MIDVRVVRRAGAAILAFGLAACATQQQSNMAETAAGAGQLSATERAQGWRSLFDGETTAGWRVYGTQNAPTGWLVRDGMLMKTAATEDIITTEQFGDFELAFDWRIATGGNAGVFYRATEEYEKVYWSATEYQLLDDPNARDGRNRLTSAGANYGLYPAPAGVVKPAGEWNETRIVARGPRVEHWLNGVKLLEYEYGSPDWEAKVKGSKFSAWPNYGRARRGHIAIQGDHNGELALRRIRIREIR
jgi:hypothetical protein